MKKIILLSLFTFISICLHAQNEFFAKQGYLIGNAMGSGANISRCMMSEIVEVGTNYYMYFTVEYPPQPGIIMYASSTDLNTWTVEDTVLWGVNDTTDREYVLGGPRVIKLNSGQYRMFYRCCEKYQTMAPHKYHIRSAISNDGINFIKEGIRIENHYYNTTSYFHAVGHSEFYKDEGGTLRALLSAKDTTMFSNQPDNIYTASSTDEGLTWSNFIPKYTGCHDPVVIKDSVGDYHAYFTHYDTEFYTVTSPDGAAWPTTPDTIYFIDAPDTLVESGSPEKIADLGAFVRPSGEIVITSNYSSMIGPWTEIAYYEDIYIGIEEEMAKSSIHIFPNPFVNTITLHCDNNCIGATWSITNISGIKILEGKMNSVENNLNLESLANGTYILYLNSKTSTSIRMIKVE